MLRPLLGGSIVLGDLLRGDLDGAVLLDHRSNLFIALPALTQRLDLVALSRMPPVLLELWREQHPKGHEQTGNQLLCAHQPAENNHLPFDASKEDLQPPSRHSA